MSAKAVFSSRWNAVSALARRDMILRYGRENIGFGWVMVEPMILTIGVLTLWMLAKPPYEHQVKVAALVFSGYMLLTLFRHMTNPFVAILRQSRDMLFHRGIGPWDIMIARALVEFCGATIAALLIGSVLIILDFMSPPDDMRLIVMAWLLMAYLGFAVGVCFAAITEIHEVSERFVQSSQYLLVPLSGCFFMVDWLPAQAQDMIYFVPLVHAFEMLRDGLYGNMHVTYYDPRYILASATVILLIGMSMIDKARSKLTMG